tara:strand:+ start:338 stop:493 length:156 start_codon:yes stop_codon:yes gene_type:complete
MPKAYFLLMDDDVEGKDVYELAHHLELSTKLQCEDHIWFEDEDQVHPYIAY